MRSIIILFFMTFAACAVQIEYVTIETIGSGSTRKDARMDAISEAIGQVTGRMIETTEQLSSHFQTKTDNDISQSSGVENYDKEINSATRGAVKSYTVLDEKETAYGWESKISAVVAKALPSKQSNRKKIAVMPFSSSSKLTFDRMALDALTKSLENRFGLKYNKTNPMQFMAMILTENIEAYLIQTRRFAVLDRVTSEVQMERNFVKSYSSSVEDLIKINQDSATELIVVGRLDEVSFNERVQRLPSGREIKVGEGTVAISYKIIDVGTRQVKFADTFNKIIGINEMREVLGGRTVTDPGKIMLKIAADSFGLTISEAIYPLRIVAKQGASRVILNQGGRSVKIGDVFEVFKLGEKLIDPYTKESLGREEIFAGEIQITRVNAKTSDARIISEEILIDKDYLCRKKIFSKATTSPQIKKINKEELDDLF